jgi:hypothetical protein
MVTRGRDSGTQAPSKFDQYVATAVWSTTVDAPQGEGSSQMSATSP